MYRILTVDDDPMCRMICSKTFAPEGFEMITASNGSQGMKTCAASKPDLVLLDVNLPDGNGIEICRRLKADERLRHIPILLMTGEAVAVESCVEGLEAGAEDVRVGEGIYEVVTTVEDFEPVRQAVVAKGIEPSTADISMIPQNTVRLEGHQARQLLKLMEELEDHEDVQNVYANFDIPDEVLAEV